MMCTHCIRKAEVRCRKHKEHLCGSRYCISRHRNCFTVEFLPIEDLAGIPTGFGDCEFVAPGLTWKQHGLRFIAAFGVGLLVLGVVLL